MARIAAPDLEKITTRDSIIYEGQVNSSLNGHFIFVSLEIFREEGGDLYYSDSYFARLKLNAEHKKHDIKMLCERYLKYPRQ